MIWILQENILFDTFSDNVIHQKDKILYKIAEKNIQGKTLFLFYHNSLRQRLITITDFIFDGVSQIKTCLAVVHTLLSIIPVQLVHTTCIGKHHQESYQQKLHDVCYLQNMAPLWGCLYCSVCHIYNF